MAIRFEYQPAGASAGLAAYAAGQGRARERAMKSALDLYQDEQARKARREEQMQQQRWLSGRDLYKEWADEQNQARMFDQQNLLQESRNRAILERDKYDDWREQDKSLTGRLAELEREHGGFFNDTKGNNVTQRYADMKNQLREIDKDNTREPWEKHQERIEVQQEFWENFNEERDTIAKKDRPGAEYEDETTGWIMKRPEKPGDPPTRVKPIDEQEEIKKTIIPYTPEEGGPTIYLQPKTDRYGNRIPGYEQAFDVKKEVPYADQVAQVTKNRKSLEPKVAKDLGLPRNEEEWTPEDYEKRDKRLDELAPYPERGTSGAPAAGAESGAPKSPEGASSPVEVGPDGVVKALPSNTYPKDDPRRPQESTGEGESDVPTPRAAPATAPRTSSDLDDEGFYKEPIFHEKDGQFFRQTRPGGEWLEWDRESNTATGTALDQSEGAGPTSSPTAPPIGDYQATTEPQETAIIPEQPEPGLGPAPGMASRNAIAANLANWKRHPYGEIKKRQDEADAHQARRYGVTIDQYRAGMRGRSGQQQSQQLQQSHPGVAYVIEAARAGDRSAIGVLERWGIQWQ